MLDELHPTARSLAASWLAHTNPDKVKMPTDIDPAIARAFYLGSGCTVSVRCSGGRGSLPRTSGRRPVGPRMCRRDLRAVSSSNGRRDA